jgi:hypothetical protein
MMLVDKEKLIAIIEAHHEELVDLICQRLQKLPGSHYEMIDYERHLEREEAFLDGLLQGLREESPMTFGHFIDQLSEQRSEEGYSLAEVQMALNTVEDAWWDLLRANLPPDASLVNILVITRRFFRSAKDHLAQAFLRKALLDQKELAEVRKKFRAYRKVTRRNHFSA